MGATNERLLDAAENGIRLSGYHAVSFRDLADELGIKSSSVHYYYRQKEDLGIALVERYSERFFADVEERAAGAGTEEERLRAYCQTYRNTLTGSDRICLCGMLGAETCGLPEALADRVEAFFNANIAWISGALDADIPAGRRAARAAQILATLQGAMMIATSLKNHKLFDDIVGALFEGVPS